jgi:hypothetical protein
VRLFTIAFGVLIALIMLSWTLGYFLRRMRG